MRIREQLVTSRDRTYDGVNPALGIVVHETDNRKIRANAAAHADLQSNVNVRDASWHWQVDDVEAVQSFPHTVQCWHAGDGDTPGGANLTRIAVEICVNADGDYEQALRNAAELIRRIRDEEGIPASAVSQHVDHSGKNCPRILRSRGPAAWAAFVASTDPEEVTTVAFVSPAQGRVTSEWGPRERHPVTGSRGFHRGIDIAPPTPGQRGVRVYACYAGTVRGVVTGRPNGDRRPNPWTGTWNTGNGVLIDGDGGGSEWYGHLDTIVVAPGQRVQAGDLLGTMGDSGNVSGVHLHLEMWNSRSSGGGSGAGNTRNPRIDFDRHGVRPGSAPVLPKNPTGPFPASPTSPKEMFTVSQYDNIMAELGKVKVAVGRIDPGEGTTLLGELRKLPAAIAKAVVEFTDPGSSMTLWARIKRIQDRSELTNTAVGQMAPRVQGIADTVGAPAVDATSIASQVVDLIGDQLDQVVSAAVTNAVGDLPARDLEQIVAAARADLRTRLED